jgi:hypothetical protein
MNTIKIYTKNDEGTLFIYQSKEEVKENFLWDICDIARLGGVYDIHELADNQWVSYKEKVESEKYHDGTPLTEEDAEIWLQELFADTLYDLKDIALADIEEESIVVLDN